MKVNAIQCNSCKDIIYSRTRHDYHWCSCKSCAIDGGFDYVKIIGDGNSFKSIEIEIDKTKQELYEDWNKSINKCGIIKEREEKND